MPIIRNPRSLGQAPFIPPPITVTASARAPVGTRLGAKTLTAIPIESMGGTGGGGGTAGLPTGVVLQAIDGGPTFFADKGLYVATAPFTWNGTGVGGNSNPTVLYGSGLDSTNYFGIGNFLGDVTQLADVQRFCRVGLNQAVGVQGPGFFGDQRLSWFRLGGIPFWMNYIDYGGFTTNGDIVGSETVGWYGQDEPVTVDQMTYVPVLGMHAVTATNVTIDGSTALMSVNGSVTGTGSPIFFGSSFTGFNLFVSGPNFENPGWLNGPGLPVNVITIAGYGGNPAGGATTYALNTGGTFNVSGITITQSAIPALTPTEIGGRALGSGLPGNTFFSNGDPVTGFILQQRGGNYLGPGRVSYGSAISQGATASDGTSRIMNVMGYDTYWNLFARDTTPIQGLLQGAMNQYSGGSPPFTLAQCAMGVRYGDGLDWIRQAHSAAGVSMPLWPALDNSNSKAGVAYDTQPVEEQWMAWGSVIHGARALIWFNHTDGISPSQCAGANFGSDNFECPFMLVPSTCTTTGTISGNVLTVLPGATQGSGVIYSGMVKTGGGMSGSCTILQQIAPAAGSLTGGVLHTDPTTLNVSAVVGGTINLTFPCWITGDPIGAFASVGQSASIVCQLTGTALGTGTYALATGKINPFLGQVLPAGTLTVQNATGAVGIGQTIEMNGTGNIGVVTTQLTGTPNGPGTYLINGWAATNTTASNQPMSGYQPASVQGASVPGIFTKANGFTGQVTVAGTLTVTNMFIAGIVAPGSVVSTGTGVIGTVLSMINGVVGGTGNFTIGGFAASNTVANQNMNAHGGDIPNTQVAIGSIVIGVDGTFAVTGGTTTGGTFTFTQSNIGIGGTVGTSLVGMTPAVTAINTRIRDLSPILNSPFAVAASGTLSPGNGYLVGGSIGGVNVMAYTYPSDTGIKNSSPPKNFAFATRTGYDACVKWYTGPAYTAISGETLASKTAYIFVATRQLATLHAFPLITFTINDPNATGVTVIGENRTLPIIAGQGTNAAQFQDSFDFAWTCRIYMVNRS